MEMQKGGPFFEKLSKYALYNKCKVYIEKEDFGKAYEIANESGTQMPRDLTLYLLKEHGEGFPYNPLSNLDFVPKNYLYEAVDRGLVVDLYPNIKEIKDNAFRYCSIKLLTIPSSVEKIGDSALCLNEGEIVYEGTREEFVSKFLGKSKCFYKTIGQRLICNDGVIEINKN